MRRLLWILVLPFSGASTASIGGAPSAATQDRTVFPAGPIADLVKTLPDTRAELPFSWPAWDDRSSAGWGGELPWQRWVEALRRGQDRQ